MSVMRLSFLYVVFFSRKAGWSFSTSLPPLPTSFYSITLCLFHRQGAILMDWMWETANHVMLFCHVSSRLTILRRIFLTSLFCHVCSSQRVGLSCELVCSSNCLCLCVQFVLPGVVVDLFRACVFIVKEPVLCLVCVIFCVYYVVASIFSRSIFVDPFHLPQHGSESTTIDPLAVVGGLVSVHVSVLFVILEERRMTSYS